MIRALDFALDILVGAYFKHIFRLYAALLHEWLMSMQATCVNALPTMSGGGMMVSDPGCGGMHWGRIWAGHALLPGDTS